MPTTRIAFGTPPARVRLPQWRLVAGCLYQTVWNVLTGVTAGPASEDYDLIYFDADLSWAARTR
jgi:hypothetical protein